MWLIRIRPRLFFWYHRLHTSSCKIFSLPKDGSFVLHKFLLHYKINEHGSFYLFTTVYSTSYSRLKHKVFIQKRKVLSFYETDSLLLFSFRNLPL